MSSWIAVITTAFAAISFICTVVRHMRNSPQQLQLPTRAAAGRSSNSNESNLVLCETCQIPQMGDASSWTQLDCGHWYHKNCLSLFASQNCLTCQLREEENIAARRKDAGGSKTD
ncbi:uncharacterized protein LOC128310219 [Anopheles moucheti]|uniref:uncharacterized protein LOC128310219 n=1 Tax=Anopheles moucheti TaxID=186751 RepID=UPI0022EFF0E8|nr:uncharacterized protein LOC128310219 [Anopheles moucheti]